MHGCISLHIYIQTHTHIYTHTHKHANTCVYMFVCLHSRSLLSRKRISNASHIHHVIAPCHIWMNHVTYKWVIWHMNISCNIWMSRVTHMNKLLWSTWMWHVRSEYVTSHMNGLFWTYKHVMSHMNESRYKWMHHVTYKYFTSHTIYISRAKISVSASVHALGFALRVCGACVWGRGGVPSAAFHPQKESLDHLHAPHPPFLPYPSTPPLRCRYTIPFVCKSHPPANHSCDTTQ